MILLIIQAAALLFLFLCSAFFSASETALLSLNPVQIHRMGKKHPRTVHLIEKIVSSPTSFLSTILIGNTLVNTAASVLGFVIANNFYPALGEAISIPVITVLLLLLGEVTPKRLAMKKAESLSVAFAPILILVIKLATPLRLAMEMISDFFKKSLHTGKVILSADELRTVVEVGEEQGIIDQEAKTMVDGIISLQRRQASQVMTPRVDLVGIDLEDPMTDRDKVIRNAQFRYLPVYRRNMDHPDSFLDSHRYLLITDRNFEASLIAPIFVPETASLDNLLTMFRKEDKHAAFVMDEYGGTAGLVTTGDILEEIVGEVDKNEYGPERLTIQKMAENLWIADGSESLESINYELELGLKAHGADRISGWIAAQAGRMPRTGEIVEAQGCRVTVHRTKKNRVVTVFIEKTAEKEDL